jgi:hypothetical protein
LLLINIHLRVQSRIKLVYYQPREGLGSEVKSKIVVVYLVGIITYIRGCDGRKWNIGGMMISKGKLKYLKNALSH